MKNYKQYKITTDGVYNLKKRLTKRSNVVYINSTFAHIFATKKGAENNLSLLKQFGYNDAKIIEINKVKK